MAYILVTGTRPDSEQIKALRDGEHISLLETKNHLQAANRLKVIEILQISARSEDIDDVRNVLNDTLELLKEIVSSPALRD